MKQVTKTKIGQRINSVLAEKNIMQKELAKELEVSDNVISYFCSGSRTPNTEQIIKIAKHCNVSADYLLGLSDTPTTDLELKAICKYTGLDEKAVCILNRQQELFGYRFCDELNFFNKFICSNIIERISSNYDSYVMYRYDEEYKIMHGKETLYHALDILKNDFSKKLSSDEFDFLWDLEDTLNKKEHAKYKIVKLFEKFIDSIIEEKSEHLDKIEEVINLIHIRLDTRDNKELYKILDDDDLKDFFKEGEPCGNDTQEE